MGIFYDDKKILASSWLLNYLNKNHCHKITLLSASFVAKILWGSRACASIELYFRLSFTVIQQ